MTTVGVRVNTRSFHYLSYTIDADVTGRSASVDQPTDYG
jgi:hypothetical protein